MTEESNIHYGKGGTMLTGPDAMRLMQAATLMSSMGLYKVGMVPTRGFTGTKALAMATQFTGKKYKRGQYDEAKADLKVWCSLMKSAIPTTVEA